MTDQPTQDAIVSQRDREVAADIWRDYVAKVGEVIVERCMREGGLDDGLPRTVATYRAEIEAATVERDAGVADGVAIKLADAENAGSDEAEDAWHGGCTHGARSAAAAIRNLKGQTS